MMLGTASHHDVDGDGDGSMLWPCLLPVPHMGVVSRSWRPVPSCLVLWVMWAPGMAYHGYRSCRGMPTPFPVLGV
jgi:hypothetical protein